MMGPIRPGPMPKGITVEVTKIDEVTFPIAIGVPHEVGVVIVGCPHFSIRAARGMKTVNPVREGRAHTVVPIPRVLDIGQILKAITISVPHQADT